MDEVAFADAKIQLIAGMTAVLGEVDTPEQLRKVFEGCMDAACKEHGLELSRIIRYVRETGKDYPVQRGTAATRELWIGMISKFLNSGVLTEADVRDFFETMMARAKERLAAKKKSASTT